MLIAEDVTKRGVDWDLWLVFAQAAHMMSEAHMGQTNQVAHMMSEATGPAVAGEAGRAVGNGDKKISIDLTSPWRQAQPSLKTWICPWARR